MVLYVPGNRGTICLKGHQLLKPWLMQIAPNRFWLFVNPISDARSI